MGESARSLFERSWEHVSDFRNLSTKSHMLKHAVEVHPEEELKNIKFGIKIIKTAKTSFERQIFESVEIQENRHHHFLNSRSEYNRCAVPRLMCKLGDKAYKNYEKDLEIEMAKEEEQILKIRELVKKRNKSRNKLKAPPAKRRKLETGFDNITTHPEPNIQEKRKADEPETGPEAKRMRKIDIRELFKKQEEEKVTVQESQEPSQTEDQAEQPECAANQGDGVYYGDTETVELIDPSL